MPLPPGGQGSPQERFRSPPAAAGGQSLPVRPFGPELRKLLVKWDTMPNSGRTTHRWCSCGTAQVGAVRTVAARSPRSCLSWPDMRAARRPRPVGLGGRHPLSRRWSSLPPWTRTSSPPAVRHLDDVHPGPLHVHPQPGAAHREAGPAPAWEGPGAVSVRACHGAQVPRQAGAILRA